MNKKIAIIGTVGIPGNYGGFETLADNLTRYLGKDFDITVYCSSKSYEKKIKRYNNARLIYIPIKANGMQSTLYDIVSALHSLTYAKTLVFLGVSGSLIIPFIRLFFWNKKIVTNIDGLEHQRNKWNGFAKWFLKYSEKIAVKYSTIVVTDNKVINEYVVNCYKVETVQIEYGGDNHVPISQRMIDYEYAFSVCRIEPENNIHSILEAFSKTQINLILVGNWTNSNYGMMLKEHYSKFENIKLLDPIYEPNLLNSYRCNCKVYIHGHSAGGTNPSLVEAMYLGLPILSFGVNYNRETTENKAIYFNSVTELVSSINNLDTYHLKNIGLDMNSIAKKRYTWDIITKKYAQIF